MIISFTGKRFKKNFVRVTYNYNGYPLVKELSELISRKYFGKIKQIHFEMPQDFYEIYFKKISLQKWRLKDSYLFPILVMI